MEKRKTVGLFPAFPHPATICWLGHIDFERLPDMGLIPSGGDDGNAVSAGGQAYVAVEIRVERESVTLFGALSAVDPYFDVAHQYCAGSTYLEIDRARGGRAGR